jgi:prevent-host-death family protein
MEIKASEFKARCLKLMEQVAETREPLIITKNGVQIAQLGPVTTQKPRTIIGLHSDGEVTGDLIAPAVPAENWDVCK